MVGPPGAETTVPRERGASGRQASTAHVRWPLGGPTDRRVARWRTGSARLRPEPPGSWPTRCGAAAGFRTRAGTWWRAADALRDRRCVG